MAQEESGEVTRRVLLRCAAMGGVAVPLLAACGSDEASGPSTQSGETLTSTSDVPVGGGTVLKDQEIVVTQPSEGEFKAFTSICTHQGCPVARVKAGTIECDCHGSEYDAATGEVTNPPATSPLKEVKIQVKGNNIVTA